MKRVLLAFFLFFLLCIPSSAGIIIRGSGGSGTTNYVNDANCIGAWFMNSSTSDETDQTGNGNTLSVTSGDTIPTSATVPSGYSGTSRDVERDDSEGMNQADGNGTDISGNQDFSIVAWIKIETGADTSVIVGKYYTGTSNRQYQIVYRSTDDALCGYVSSDGSTYSKAIGGTSTVDDGNWHHIAMVFDYDAGGSTLTLYLDGSVDSNGADNPKSHTGGIYDGAAYFSVGCASDASGGYVFGTGFDGLLDEVAIFDRVLSLAEIQAIKNNGLDGSKGGND